MEDPRKPMRPTKRQATVSCLSRFRKRKRGADYPTLVCNRYATTTTAPSSQGNIAFHFFFLLPHIASPQARFVNIFGWKTKKEKKTKLNKTKPRTEWG
jgi:hypothetical protein